MVGVCYLGKVKSDHNILRAIKSVCNRLPTMNSAQFKEDFLTVCTCTSVCVVVCSYV